MIQQLWHVKRAYVSLLIFIVAYVNLYNEQLTDWFNFIDGSIQLNIKVRCITLTRRTSIYNVPPPPAPLLPWKRTSSSYHNKKKCGIEPLFSKASHCFKATIPSRSIDVRSLRYLTNCVHRWFSRSFPPPAFAIGFAAAWWSETIHWWWSATRQGKTDAKARLDLQG